MLDFKFIKNKTTGEEYIETSLYGKALLTIPQLNKGTAFTEEERIEFNLKGKLPARIETLDQQIDRAYQQFKMFEKKLKRNIYLHSLLNTNQVLFYGLARRHLIEMVPLLYTPIVGDRIKEASREFRQARGLYITCYDEKNIEAILDNRSNPNVDLIVVTDGERILGIGDQGVGGMDIPVAKLMVYSFCGAIDPNRTLPILLDVGTNNQELLDDPLYLGLRQNRIKGKPYDDFIEALVTAIKKKFPNVLLHWEDFGRENAYRNLNRFRDQICSFNDDIQGTGVVTLAALLTAVKLTGSTLADQRIVIFGAGSAGVGTADQIIQAMSKTGLSLTEARKHIWLVDRSGLITEETPNLTPAQKDYARRIDEVKSWKTKESDVISFQEVISNVKPTVLIGCSTAGGAFTQSIVETMAAAVEQPIIFPLSNPTEKAEANPEDLLVWTKGKALIATGTPFEDVMYQGEKVYITQCNNAYAFPGLGWGAISVKAKKISEAMLIAVAEALSEFTIKTQNSSNRLLPLLENIDKSTYYVALAVANAARKEGLATITDVPVEELIENNSWTPHYVPYRRKR